jgi:hypothetical protein
MKFGIRRSTSNVVERIYFWFVESKLALAPTKPPQPPIQWVPGAGGVKMTTHLHLVARLRIRVAIPSIPQYVFMARYLRTGATLL